MKEKEKQSNKSPKKEKKEEKVNWPEIMGINRPTYGRNRHGAITNKRN